MDTIEKEMKIEEKVDLVKQHFDKCIRLLCELPTMPQFKNYREGYQTKLIDAIQQLNKLKSSI